MLDYKQHQDVYHQTQDQGNMQGLYTVAPVYDNQYQHQPLQQDPIHAIQPIQPDPLPRALTQVPANTIPLRPGAAMEYAPQFTAPDTFHNTMCGCFKDFFTCKNMSTC